ncbi:MAG TPA: elongation factor P [Spirochaetota bacterium]|nr:elongation factor P [Spirochaetota bacterium]
MADTSSLKKGVAIKNENKIWFVIDVFFVSPGKGAAFFRTRLKEIGTGKVVEKTFKSGEPIELIDTERKNVQFLYKDKGHFIFMDEENYEQYSIDENIASDNVCKFMKENDRMILLYAAGEIMDIEFKSAKNIYTVTEAAPGIKGDTATNTTKAVKLETGAELQVPLFIKEGDKVLVNVDTGAYCERAKE